MELKYLTMLSYEDIKDCFNRTFMELKLRTVAGLLLQTIGFNRTFMELKLTKQVKKT